jgi:LDH2 family malate/lactate/ureidoglycolate dehydrogenase
MWWPTRDGSQHSVMTCCGRSACLVTMPHSSPTAWFRPNCGVTPSHGVLRLPWYAARLRSGVMHAVTEPELLTDAGAIAVLDGHDGVGQVIAARAMREAIDRAEEYGIGSVAVRNSNHFGTAAYFTRMAPPRGYVALLTTNASPAMAPWGGRAKVVGSNPWSLAAPAGRYGTVVMDIANTAVARGKIYVAAQEGKPIPDTWALDASGARTTDPRAAIAGIVQPMAGHKGCAISFMMDVLSGVLTGSSFGSQIGGPYQSERRSGCGHLAIALRIGAFRPLPDFTVSMERLIDEVKAVPTAQGYDEIFFPGELEERNAGQAMDIRLSGQTVADLEELGWVSGIDLAVRVEAASS